MLLALFGATAGQGVVWYAGQFYALFFLTLYLKVDYLTAYILIGVSLIIGTPFFIVFGALSDKIGRKWIILAGCLIAAVTYFPLFKALTHNVNPALEQYVARTPITVALGHVELIERTAIEAGHETGGHADHDGEEDGEDPRLHRDARAPDHAGEHVAPQIVRPERMRGTGRLADLAPVGAQRIGRSNPGRAEREQDVEQYHRCSRQRGRAPGRATPGPLKRRRLRPGADGGEGSSYRRPVTAHSPLP